MSNDARSTRRQGATALADQAVVSGASLLTTVFVGRRCGDDALGLFALAMTIMALSITAQHSLVLTPYTFYANRLEGDRRARFAGSVLVQAALLAVGCASASGLLAAALYLGDFNELAPLIAVVSVVLPLTLLRDFVRRVEFAHLRVAGALRIDVAVLAVQLLALIVLWKTERLSPLSALLAIGFASGLASSFVFFRSRRSFQFSAPNFRVSLQRNWRFGRWVFGDSMIGALKYQTIPWILLGTLGVGAAGAYSACQSVIGLSRPLLQGFWNFLIPKIAHTHASGGVAAMKRLVNLSALLLCGAMLIFVLAVLLLGEWAVSAVYGPNFDNLGNVAILLALGVAVSAIAQPLTAGLMALHRADLGFAVRAAGFVVTLMTTLLLVERTGIAGAATGLLAGSVLGLGMTGAFYRRTVRKATEQENRIASPSIETSCV